MSTTKDPIADNNDDSFRTCDCEQAADTHQLFTASTSDDESPIEQGAQSKIRNDADWFHDNKTSTRRMTDETARIENLSMLSRANHNDDGIFSTGRISTISFASNVNIPIDETALDETAILYPDEKEENIGLLPDDDEETLEDNGGDYGLPFDSFSSKCIEFLLPTLVIIISYPVLPLFLSLSVLFVAKWNKNDVVRSLMQYGFPISVFFMQMLIMTLLMINLLQTSDRQLNTTMNVPVSIRNANYEEEDFK